MNSADEVTLMRVKELRWGGWLEKAENLTR